MANVKMITTALNTYFNNNKIMIGNEIPTDGSYNVGDIMIKETQVAGEAIGWVCVAGGSSATWSEFGKELTIEDGSVNMAKLADDVRLKLALIDAVNVSIKSVRSDIDDLQTDVETLTSDVENINTVIEEKVGENIGDLTELITEDKSNLVNAINVVRNKVGWTHTTSTSSDQYVEKSTKIATIILNEPWSTAIGNISFIPMENYTLVGDAFFYFRSKDTLSDVECYIDWKYIDWGGYADCLDVVKVSDGVFDIYLYEYEEWSTVNYKLGHYEQWNSEINLLHGQEHVEFSTIEENIVYTSELYGEAGHAKTIGDLANLQTTNKDTVVAAINEVFQSGVDVKNKLVEALASKDVSCSTSDTFDDLITKIESMIVAPSWAASVGLPAAAAEMSVARRFLTSAVIGTNIYAIGGYTGSATSTNEMYDTITNTWTTKSGLSNSIYGGAAVSCNGSIYHLGGYSYTTYNYMYNPTTNTWTSKTSLPYAKQYSAAVEVDGKVYISQGNNTYNMAYDPSTNAWTQLTRNSTTGGNYVSSAYYNGKIYVMGGASYPTYAYSYDVANDTWATITSIPTGFYRAGQHGMVYKDKIYFMAGTYNSATSNKILRYDPVANTWELLSITLPVAVYGPATEIVNGKMYCMGGYYNTYMKNNQMLLL